MRYFDVSNSWNPGSAKLNTMSFIFWMFSPIASTSRPTSRLNWSVRGFEGAAGAAGAGCCAAGSETVNAIAAPINSSKRDLRIKASKECAIVAGCQRPGLVNKRLAGEMRGGLWRDARVSDILVG